MSLSTNSNTNISIIAKPSPVSAVCSFAIDQLSVGKTIHCTDKAEASDPFVKMLMDIEGVCEVLVNDRLLTVSKGSSTRDWRDLGKEIGVKIREIMSSGNELFITSPVEDTESNKSVGLAVLVSRILNKEINPSLASHNGAVTLVRVDEEKQTVFVRMEGGCQGCARASQTMKNGVEKHLMERIPELKAVIDVTNHDDGDNPFY